MSSRMTEEEYQFYVTNNPYMKVKGCETTAALHSIDALCSRLMAADIADTRAKLFGVPLEKVPETLAKTQVLKYNNSVGGYGETDAEKVEKAEFEGGEGGC